MNPGSFDQYRLDLGGVVLGFRCDPPPFAAFLAHWFDRPSALNAPHVELDFQLIPGLRSRALPNTLLKTKNLQDQGGFDIAEGLFKGQFSPETGRGLIQAQAELARGSLMRVMEQIFYQAYFSARDRIGQDSWLVHSAGVIVDGQGFLFVGPSEAGKSTAARNSAAHHVLGDEMNLVQFTPEGVFLEGTPFNGLFRDKQPGRAPLRAVFLLKQAPENRIAEMGSAEAGSVLAAEVVPPVGLDQIPDPDTILRMVDTAARIIDRVETVCLELRNDPGFWPIIASRYGLALN